MKRLDWLLKKFNLDWVVYNYRSEYGRVKIIIAPFYDGSVPQDEILRREIPSMFIVLAKLLHPRTKMVVRGLATRQEIDNDMAFFRMANAS